MKIANHIYAILVLLSTGSCRIPEKDPSSTNSAFKIPVLIQSPQKDTIEYFKADHLDETWYLYMGKHRFADTITIKDYRICDRNYRADLVNENHIRDLNNPASDGFQLFTDYNSSVYVKEDFLNKGQYYFPVYLVNETSRTKFFIGKDSYAFGIQEAVDTSDYDRWRPIEGRGFDFCGNGYFGMKVHPGEFIMILAPKYQGNDTGLMRIRLKIGESVYLSNSFEGRFSQRQFEAKKGTFIYDILKKNDPGTVQWGFYGGIPKTGDE